MIPKSKAVVVAVALCAALAGVNASPILSARRLAVNGLLRDAVVDAGSGAASRDVVFTWEPAASEGARGVSQSAYRLVITRAHDDAPVWSSGKVDSATPRAAVRVEALPSRTVLRWRVTWWSDDGAQAPESEAAEFTTGLRDVDWGTSKWIGGNAPWLRTEFNLDATPAPHDGVLALAIPSWFQLFVNGKRVGVTETVASTWTVYNVRTTYWTYDLSSVLQQGTNAIGIMLGRGWRNLDSYGVHNHNSTCDVDERLVRAVLSVGGKNILQSDTTWQMSMVSPVVMDSIYNGETYDARLEQPGWDMPNFKPGTDWVAAEAYDCFTPALRTITIPRIATISENPPVNITKLSNPTRFVVDFGKNLAGWTRISAKGPSGTNITIRHAEVLQHPPYGPVTGDIYVGNLRSAKATDTYFMSGDPSGETFEPHFTYHGFRFAEVTGYPGELTASDISQVHFRSALTSISTFNSSSDILNQIHFDAMTGQASNLMSVPTDCDQRDERLGWMGDAGLSSDSMAVNFDTLAFHSWYVQNIVDAQEGNGDIPDVVPFMRYGSDPGDPSWSAAFPQIMYVLYKVKGDLTTAKTFWPQLGLYFDEIEAQLKAAGSIKAWRAPYGDWVAIKKGSNQYSGAFNLVVNLRQAAELATKLGYSDNATALTAKADAVAAQIQSEFFDSTKGCWDDCEQTSYAEAIQIQLPTTASGAAATALLNDIVSTNKNHVTVGIIGAKALFPVLDGAGKHDAAVSLMMQTSYPSWGYMRHNQYEPDVGALWELWDSPTQGPGMNSRNHHMFSAPDEWIVNTVGGISSQAAGAVCFLDDAELTLRPAHSLAVSGADASIAAPCGTTSLTYTRHGGTQCAVAAEGASIGRPLAPAAAAVALSCGAEGGKITSVDFASWGRPEGACGAFEATEERQSGCHAPLSDAVVSKLCLGQESCMIPTHADFWAEHGWASESIGKAYAHNASSPCGSLENPRRLHVQVTCSAKHVVTSRVAVPVGVEAAVHLPTFGHSDVNVQLEEEEHVPLFSDGAFASSLPNGVSRVQRLRSTGDDAAGDLVAVSVHGGTFQLRLEAQ